LFAHKTETVLGMSDETGQQRYLFPPAANWLMPALTVMALGALVYMPLVVGLGASPRTTAVGYAPQQPIAYSHALHAGTLGIDCRYCHSTVETSAFAAIPPAQVCMNCHAAIKADSPALAPLRESYARGTPLKWIKVHDLPDYVFFDHSAHVSRGVGCVSCHGRVDQMAVVRQTQPLSMAWCLDCHRRPEPHLRPLEHITTMNWAPGADPSVSGPALRKQYGIRSTEYLTNCTTCHR